MESETRKMENNKNGNRVSDLLLTTAFVLTVLLLLSIISYWLGKPERPSWVSALNDEIDKKTESYWLGNLGTIATDYAGNSYRVTIFDSQMLMIYDNVILAQAAPNNVLPTNVMTLTELIESASYCYGFAIRYASPSNIDSTGASLATNFRYISRQFKDDNGYTRFVRIGQSFT